VNVRVVDHQLVFVRAGTG